MKYSEKLRDPRWQRRRLDILQRDDFTCQICFDTTTTLHVHHRRYLAGREPWEYGDHDLTTLCKPCHDLETEAWPEAMACLVDVLCARGLFAGDVQNLASSLMCAEGNSQFFLSLIELIAKDRTAQDFVCGRFHQLSGAKESVQ